MRLASYIRLKFAIIMVALLFQGCKGSAIDSSTKNEQQFSNAWIPPWQISGLRFRSGDIVDFAQVIYANGNTFEAGDVNRGKTTRTLWFEQGEHITYAEFGYQEPGVKYGGHLEGVLIRTNKGRVVYGGYPPSYFPGRYSEEKIQRKRAGAGFFLGLAFQTYGNHVGKAYAWAHTIPGYQAPETAEAIMQKKLTEVAIEYGDIVDVVKFSYEGNITSQYGESRPNAIDSIKLYYYLDEDEYITGYQLSRTEEGRGLINGIFIKTNKDQEILGGRIDPRYNEKSSSKPMIAKAGNYFWLGFIQNDTGSLTGPWHQEFLIP